MLSPFPLSDALPPWPSLYGLPGLPPRGKQMLPETQGGSHASRRGRSSRQDAGEAAGVGGKGATRAHAARLRKSRLRPSSLQRG